MSASKPTVRGWYLQAGFEVRDPTALRVLGVVSLLAAVTRLALSNERELCWSLASELGRL